MAKVICSDGWPVVGIASRGEESRTSGQEQKRADQEENIRN